MKIASIGEITIDRYLRQNRSFVGGISLNFAIHAKRSGADVVSLVSCVGHGAEGAWVLKTLDREGVDHSHVATLTGKTAEIDIDVHENGERFFPKGGYRANVLSQFHLSKAMKAFIGQHDICVTFYDGDQPDSLTTQLLQLSEAQTKRKLKCVIDFGDWSGGRRKAVPQAVWRQVDLAFISGDEGTINELLPIAGTMDGLMVITMGKAGSAALTPDGIQYQRALPVAKLVDSTGCGDAFQAAFTVSYFRDGDIATALDQGATRAARVLQHFGAFEQVSFESVF